MTVLTSSAELPGTLEDVPAAVGVDRHGRARLLRARRRARAPRRWPPSWASRRAPPAACWPRSRRPGCWSAPSSGRYRLGLRLFEIGQLAVDRLMLRELAVPVLGELRDLLRETAQLAVPVGTEVLYIDRLEGSGAGTMFHTELYRRGPGHSSSAAKAIAAYNPTMARGDPGEGLRAAHAVHDRRPASLPAGAAPGAGRRVRGLARGAHAGDLVDRGADRAAPRRADGGGRGDLGGRDDLAGAGARGRSRSCRVSVGPRPPVSAARWRPAAGS